MAAATTGWLAASSLPLLIIGAVRGNVIVDNGQHVHSQPCL